MQKPQRAVFIIGRKNVLSPEERVLIYMPRDAAPPTLRGRLVLPGITPIKRKATAKLFFL